MKSKIFFLLKWVLVLVGLGSTHCARSPIKNPGQAMRVAKASPPQIVDDMRLEGLKEALQKTRLALRKKPVDLQFGPTTVTAENYILVLDDLVKKLAKMGGGEEFATYLAEHFDLYEVYGGDRWGEVFITSYFEPILEGRKHKTGRFSQALYATPKDLVEIRWGQFVETLPQLSDLSGKVFEQKSRQSVLRGRLVAEVGQMAYVVPYFDRAEIDLQQRLEKYPGLVLAWVDPVDAFFMHIQGSGTIQWPNGKKTRLGYASQNGYPYVPIGRFLLDAIPLENMSLQSIESHIRSRSPEEVQFILNKNPSYVFFRKLTGDAETFMGAEVTSGRTIATDYSLYPKGGLALLQYEKPVFSTDDTLAPQRWETSMRLVVDQDTGGAIRGPHRVDLYWGKGDAAKQMAGVMRHSGQLHYFVPRKSYIAELQPSKPLNSGAGADK